METATLLGIGVFIERLVTWLKPPLKLALTRMGMDEKLQKWIMFSVAGIVGMIAGTAASYFPAALEGTPLAGYPQGYAALVLGLVFAAAGNSVHFTTGKAMELVNGLIQFIIALAGVQEARKTAIVEQSQARVSQKLG